MKYIIGSDTCNNEEEQFSVWIEKHYPKLDVVIENTDYTGLFINGEHVDATEYLGRDLWERYCSE